VNHEQCICQENLDASKHSQHDAIADLRDINKDEPYTVDAEECCWRLQPNLNLNLLLGHRNLYYPPQLHWFP